MNPLQVHVGLVATLNRENVNTDDIIPKQYLKSTQRNGFGKNCFDSWRYLSSEIEGRNVQDRQINPEFELNQPRFAGATILITGKNFGCGSSREHAPWALLEYGFRVIIAPSFGDIFFQNAFESGILPVVLGADAVGQLFQDCADQNGYTLSVDLVKQIIFTPHARTITFSVDPFQRDCLLKGSDSIDRTLEHSADIAAFEKMRIGRAPWLDYEFTQG